MRGDLGDDWPEVGGAGGATAVGIVNRSKSVVETRPDPERERIDAVREVVPLA